MIKSELARFEQERVEDFKNSLLVFLDGMIARQKEVSHFLFGVKCLLNTAP